MLQKHTTSTTSVYNPGGLVVFSGSAVIDRNNTSGFVPNQTDGVVAIYTLNTPAKDDSAGQFYHGIPDEDPISIPWVSNWQSAQEVSTPNEGWRGVMTLPRRHFLTNVPRTGWMLVSLPYDLSPVL
ncbi:hypothetical protein C8T65DRAFT_739817 [Cerioporus squamosus]|nr:hypothetical protein C8T65DRAFT_739817 [Cerioporus squamosus]